MPITSYTYDAATGEMVYILTPERSVDVEIRLAIRPAGKKKYSLILWQGDRYEQGNNLVAQGDPVRLVAASDIDAYYEVVERVFGSGYTWVREALAFVAWALIASSSSATFPSWTRATKDGDIVLIKGTDPETYATPEGYAFADSSTGQLRYISNWVARIVEDVLVDDGSGQTERFYTVEATLEGQVRRFEVSAASFDNLSWVAYRLGARARKLKPAVTHPITNAIKLQSQGLKEVHAFGHTGWVDVDGRWVYVHAGGAVVAPGSRAFNGRVVLRGKLACRAFPSAGAQEDYAAAVGKTFDLWDLADDRIAVPIMLAPIRAALGEVDFSIHLAGETGLGKTTLALVMASFFGMDLTEKDQTNFESTQYSIEVEGYIAKDQLLLVDDYRPRQEPGHRRILAFLARTAANMSGRTRLSGGGSVLVGDKPPRALVVTTGEDLPVGESLVARLLILKMDPSDGLDFSQGAPINQAQKTAREGVYALALRGFIEWLAGDYAAYRARLLERRRALGYEVQARVGHPRTPGIYGDLLATLELWLEYALSVEAIDEVEKGTLLERGRVALMAAILEQGKYLAQADPAIRLQALLRDAIVAGEAYIKDPVHPEEEGQGTLLGWVITGQGILLLPNTSLEIAATAATRAGGEPFVMSKQALNQALLDRGLLAATNLDKSRKSITVRRKIEGKMQTGLLLKDDFFGEA